MFGLVGYAVWFAVRSPYLQALLILISLGVALFVVSRAPPAGRPSPHPSRRIIQRRNSQPFSFWK